MSGPRDLAPQDAWKRYVARRRTELTDGSADSYHYRLKLWGAWCEEQEIESVSELNGWLLDEYRAHRSGEGIASSTLHNEMKTLRGFVEYLERIDAVDDGLADKVQVPRIPEDERSRETKLATDDALALINYYRNDEQAYGSLYHAFLEVAWHTGARLGGIRGLDLRDFDRDIGYLEFVHRPETETPLKNKRNGERMVKLRPNVVDVLEAYIEGERWRKHDEFGRSPLFTSTRGRPGRNTVRVWAYKTTMPCIHGPCPHGHVPRDCEFRTHTDASKCPSSRAPHHIRTGSITWHRDRGIPKEVTAERVNASQRVIDRHYDKSTKFDEMQLRRAPHLDKLDIGGEEQ